MRNEDFYKADGSFDSEKAKLAYLDMLKKMNHSFIPSMDDENLWVADFNSNKFTEVGVGGYVFVNDNKYGYSSCELLLLPGQILPEHKHVATEICGPKMETWAFRHGSVVSIKEGGETPGIQERLPESVVHSRLEENLGTGDVSGTTVEAGWHWMKAGPEGAVFTEYSTYSDFGAVRFSDSDLSVG